MKKMLFAFTAASLLCFSACKKDDKPETKTTFTASLNGEAYTGSMMTAVSTPPDTTFGSHLTLTVSAIDEMQNLFAVAIEFPHDQRAAGTYHLTDSTGTSISYIRNDTMYTSAFIHTSSGAVVLNHVDDHHADGTFSGMMTNDEGDTLSVTQGVFSVKW